jgi:hypothetical protein
VGGILAVIEHHPSEGCRGINVGHVQETIEQWWKMGKIDPTDCMVPTVMRALRELGCTITTPQAATKPGA